VLDDRLSEGGFASPRVPEDQELTVREDRAEIWFVLAEQPEVACGAVARCFGPVLSGDEAAWNEERRHCCRKLSSVC
jgi:hypothetical protein